MVKLIECTKRFRKRIAVDHLSATLDTGIIGLLGPNGAGKTTLLRCICGVYKLNGGAIQGGEDGIGYLPQQFGMFKALSVYQMMEYLATLKKIPKQAQKSEIERCVELVNLSDRLRSRISTLSGGMIRRLGIAQALLGNPEVVLFDEPTAGLDPEERVRFKNVVASRRHQGVTLISTHIVSDVEACCDKILIMNEGKLVTVGSSQQIANLAQGKVYIVPGAQESDLCDSYYVKDRVEDGGVTQLRVLSSAPQPGKLVAPTMEDGYLCAIKGY